MKTIVELLENSSQKYANNPYILEKKTDKYEAITYRETKEQVYKVAAGLIALGIRKASPVISGNTEKKHKLGSSGVIVKPLELKICDDNGNEMPVGEKGEIVVRGENVMKGYWKNEKTTRETLRDGWLHTGDIGYVDSDGFLYVLGRFKSLLISDDGEKYSPEGIEETKMTGIKHKNGTISMARNEPGSATSEFFICVGNQPELDFGGKRNPDGQGFAAFGKVIKGMDVVRKIHSITAEGQYLQKPVLILEITRAGKHAGN